MKRTWKMVVAAVAAATVGLASVAAIGTGAGAQGSVRGVTDTEIKVGGLGVSAIYSDAQKAAQARFDLAAKNKEIPGGRKIVSAGFKDDKQTADINLQEGRALVDQDRVFAVVPVVTPTLQASAYFNQQKVPTLGWGIAAGYCEATNKYIFGFTGCLVPDPVVYAGNTWGELVSQQLQAQGKGSAKGKAAAVVTEDSTSGKSGSEVISATAEAVGMKVVYAKQALPAPPATVTDYSPYVQDIMTSNGGQPPDAIFLTLTVQNVIGLGRALAQAGFKGIQTNAVSYAPQLTPLATGWSAFTQFATPEATAPEMKNIVAAMNTAGVAQIGQPALAGWFAADMFIKVLGKVGKNLTPERFQKAAAKYTYEIEDIIGPTVYPQAFKASTPCGQLATSDGTKWVVTAPFDCYEILLKKGDKYTEIPYPQGVK